MELKDSLTITIAILAIFIGTLFGYYILGDNFSDKLDKKYCDLSKEIDGEILIHPAYEEMIKEVEDYSGGEYFSGQTIGKKMGSTISQTTGKDLDYVCWYDLRVKKGNIIETITIQHIFVVYKVLEGDNLMEWRGLE